MTANRTPQPERKTRPADGQRRTTKVDGVKRYVEAISSRAEFFIVIALAFGLSMLGSLFSVFAPTSDAPISEAHLRFLLVYETLVFVALGVFLSLRGWSLRRLGVVPNTIDTAIGIGIAVVAYLCFVTAWLISVSFMPELKGQVGELVTRDLSLTTVVAVSLLNPLFEEVFVCGYTIAALRKTRGVSFAINVSVGIRLVYHLYQGAVGVISIIPLGFIFAYWYARTGRLWPVIVAHGIFDLAGLMVYVGS